MNATGTHPKSQNTVLAEVIAFLLANAFNIKFYGENLEAAIQAENRADALIWQTKMYAAIKARNVVLMIVGVIHA